MALHQLGTRYFLADGVAQDKSKGLECFFRGAELGHSYASHSLAHVYYLGDGIAKDEKKAAYYEELAAMQGHNKSRDNLGINEYSAGKYDKALKHWLIACERGRAQSLKNIENLFRDGLATKGDYEKGLVSFQEYIAEIKSDERDEAAASDEMYTCLPLQNS